LQVFGLHRNAAVAFDNSETKYLIDTIISIQPVWLLELAKGRGEEGEREGGREREGETRGAGRPERSPRP